MYSPCWYILCIYQCLFKMECTSKQHHLPLSLPSLLTSSLRNWLFSDHTKNKFLLLNCEKFEVKANLLKMTWAEEYFGASLRTKGGSQTTASAVENKKYVAIYFSAHWVSLSYFHKYRWSLDYLIPFFIISLFYLLVPSLPRFHSSSCWSLRSNPRDCFRKRVGDSVCFFRSRWRFFLWLFLSHALDGLAFLRTCPRPAPGAEIRRARHSCLDCLEWRHGWSRWCRWSLYHFLCQRWRREDRRQMVQIISSQPL